MSLTVTTPTNDLEFPSFFAFGGFLTFFIALGGVFTSSCQFSGRFYSHLYIGFYPIFKSTAPSRRHGDPQSRDTAASVFRAPTSQSPAFHETRQHIAKFILLLFAVM
jgi:hypothetical protein